MEELLRISMDGDFVVLEQDFKRLGWTPILRLKQSEAKELMTKMREVMKNQDMDWVELKD